MEPAPSDVDVVRLELGGLTCAACVGRVERALTQAAGVRRAEVNLATSRARVEFDAGIAGPESLASAVRAAGYDVHSVQLVRTAGGPGSETAAEGPAQRARAVRAREAQAVEERRQLVRAAAWAASLALPVVALAMAHGAWPFAHSSAGRAVQAVLTTAVVFGPGREILALAWRATRAHSADMHSLVALGVLAAWGYSSVELIRGGHLYFEAAATIIAFVLLGKVLESRARARLGDAVRGLVALVPAQARRRNADGTEVDVELEALRPGDIVLVRPGERIPSDGVVLEGRGALDESLLTGESAPVIRGPTEDVFGGALLVGGNERDGRIEALAVRITRTGAHTLIARMASAVEAAQATRAPIARVADRVAAVFVPMVLGIALLTALVWLAIGGDAGVALERAVAVLVIACPCALGLATPAAIAVGTARGAELGILFKGGEALEAAARLDRALFDKTGTLTEGRPRVTSVVALGGADGARVLRRAAAVEQKSEHPLARALVAEAAARDLVLPRCEQFAASIGAGVEGRVGGALVRVGTARWFATLGLDTSEAEPEAARLAEGGETPVLVAFDRNVVGVIGVADTLRADAVATIAALRARGVEPAILTGDRAATAARVARELGIDEVHAELSPAAKAGLVRESRAAGCHVAMIGDGVNDAEALASAHIGIALGSGTDIALAASDVALLGGGLGTVVCALDLARATLRTIRRNLLWASIYNVVGIPIAAGVFEPSTGWSLSPMFASLAMSLSSVSVLMSSLSLRSFGPGRAA